jgi:ATP-dependent Clp protease ATP-binding subunit ClpA
MTMFDCLDPDAQAITSTAIAYARQMQHGYLGTEHLLLSAIAHRRLLPPAARAALPADVDVARLALLQDLGDPRPETASDAALLATLGIDLAEVRRRAEQTFGTAAVDRAALQVKHPRARRRRGRCYSVLVDGLGVMPRVKEALARAARQAEEHHDAQVGAVRLLGAMLEDDRAMANHLLIKLSFDSTVVRASFTAALDD